MNNIRTCFVLSMLMISGLAVGIQPVSAGVKEECRQEAADYEVAPELRDEYISGCIESRGGESAPNDVQQIDLEPSYQDDTNSQADDSNQDDLQPSYTDDTNNTTDDGNQLDLQPSDSDETNYPTEDSYNVTE